MRCSEYEDYLAAYIDGELNEKQIDALQEHLDVCDTCREALAALQTIKEHMQDIESIALPGTFHKDLMERVKDEQKGSNAKRQYSKVRIVTYLSTVAAAALVCVWIGSNQVSPYSVAEKGNTFSAPSTASDEITSSEDRLRSNMSPMIVDATTYNHELVGDGEASYQVKGVSEVALDQVLQEWALEHKVQLIIEQAGSHYSMYFDYLEDRAAFEVYVKETLGGTMQLQGDTNALTVEIIFCN